MNKWAVRGRQVVCGLLWYVIHNYAPPPPLAKSFQAARQSSSYAENRRRCMHVDCRSRHNAKRLSSETVREYEPSKNSYGQMGQRLPLLLCTVRAVLASLSSVAVDQRQEAAVE